MVRPKISTILISFGLFLFFLFLLFPYQNLRGYVFGKVHQSTGIHIVADDMYPSIFGWPGIGLTNVSVSVPMGRSDLEIAAKKLVLRAGLSGFLPPSPAVTMSMDGLKKGGDLYLKFSQGRSRVSASIQAEAVDMRQLAFEGLPEPIPGKLDLDSDAVVDLVDFSKTTGNADLNIQGLKVPALNLQGIILPELKLGDVRSKIVIRNGVAELPTFQFGGKDADLQGTLTGDIRLGKTWEASFLNLTLRVKVSDAYRQNPQGATLVSLLETYKTAAGDEYAMKWGASIFDMTTNFAAALPQRPN